jgi:hypothetical protein
LLLNFGYMKGLKKMEREIMGRHGDIADCGLRIAD